MSKPSLQAAKKKPTRRKPAKRDQAESIYRVHTGRYDGSVSRIGDKVLYRTAVRLGYYWNVAKGEWQSVRLTLVHLGSAHELGAEDRQKEYVGKLLTGGVLTLDKKGKLRRTSKIELPRFCGDFDYGR